LIFLYKLNKNLLFLHLQTIAARVFAFFRYNSIAFTSFPEGNPSLFFQRSSSRRRTGKREEY